MFYERIVISGCERFSVSGRYYIEIKPTAKVQMILGTNGSGKTTLAQLGFSPMAIESKFMRAGGYFIKEGTYKGDRYRLEGKYAGKGKQSFSFYKNDEELLKDGTLTTYHDLVEIHLDYNKWLQDLLTGRVLFTNLGPAQRQDLLSKISKSDFTEAFRLLKEYKRQYTHYNEISKFLTKRIDEERVRLLDGDDFKVIEEEKAGYVKEYKQLSQIEIPKIDNSARSVMDVHNELLREVKSYLDRLPTNPAKTSQNAITELLGSIKAREESITEFRDTLNKEIESIQQQLGVMDGDTTNVKERIEELKRLKQELSELPTNTYDIPIEYLQEGISQFAESLLVLINELPSELPDNEQVMSIERDMMEKTMQLHKYQGLLERIESELKTIASIEEVACPSCSTVFKPGVDVKRVGFLEEQRGKGINAINTAERSLEEVKVILNQSKEEQNKMEALEIFKRNNSGRYPGLFKYIDSVGGFKLGKELIGHVRMYLSASTIYFKKRMLESNIERLEVVLAHVKDLEEKQDGLKGALDTSVKTLYKYNREIYLKQTEYREVSDGLDYVIEEEQIVGRIEALIRELDHCIENELFKHQLHVKAQMSNEVLSRIATLDAKLSEQTVVMSLIKDFETQLDNSKLQADVYAAIVKEMSPKTGIIAEQIILSIGTILKGLNQLFEKIWGYPLQVEIGQVGDNGLDYKFPMKDSVMTRDDVADGSDSMIEMVNRAVIIMSYFSLDIHDMPLFLDEPGRTFDKTHKLNLIPFIRDLSDSTRYSQIVLISHSEDVQTAFPNSQTIIMDDRNIQYPHPYNEHVSFEIPEKIEL